MAYNPEDVGSKPTAGNISIWSFYRNDPSYAKRRKTQQTHILYRGGAEAARGAHNSEVTRSRRVSGIISLRSFYRSDQHNTTPVAQLEEHHRRG
jgi:hypothetical protein